MNWRICVVAIAFMGVPKQLFAFCSKPDAPYCASQYDKFDDQQEFESCKSEMESYKSEVEDFTSCLKRESEGAISDYNDAVQSFNVRAGS
jgi:hypothetical protein